MRLPNRQGRHQFWERVRGGLGWWEAAADAGISQRTAERWFRQAGGIMPPNVPALSGQRCLSLSEGEEIFAGVERGDSIRAIAMSIGRWPSTVYRELQQAPSEVQSSPSAWPTQDATLELSTQLGSRTCAATSLAAEEGQAGCQCQIAEAGAIQTEGKAEPGADRCTAATGVPGPAGDVGVPGSHLPSDLRSGQRCIAARAGSLSPHWAGASQATAQDCRAPGPNPQHGHDQRAPTRSRRSCRSWPLGRRPADG